MSDLSNLAKARALRRLFYNGGFWGAYGQIIVVTGPVFTGFALWMGLNESDIALIASIVALAGVLQPLSFYIAGRLINQKRFIILGGILEITLTTSVILIPLITAALHVRFILAAVAILAGMSAGNLVAPLFNSWFSALLPEDSRAKVIGRRMIVVNLAAMGVGYGTGRFIDFFPGTHLTFVAPYVLAWIVGVLGYLVLVAIPFPSVLNIEGKITISRTLGAPFRNFAFRRLLLFTLMLTFGGLVAEPFFNVFMIRDLGISYAVIAILSAITLGTGIIGYWLWGVLAARFGNKPILQLLVVPRFIIPFLWVVLTPANGVAVLAVIMVIIGITYSGITVAINTLLFAALADVKDRSAYFAVWSMASAIVISLATAMGGILTKITSSMEVLFLGLRIDNIRMIFLISGLLLMLSLLFLRRIHDTEAKPVTHLLGQVFRGNPLSFAYNSFVYSKTGRNRNRARAARNMGRSKNPMAVGHLAQAMGDADPTVREEAVKGLGESKAPAAVRHLAGALEDEESDVQAEAAASLGKLKFPEGIEPLLKALDSEDIRVAISAARALGVIGGEDIGDSLYKRLLSSRNKMLIPTLIESLSTIGDIRVVDTALTSLPMYRSPVIRLQLINAACRALGAGNLFYKLLSKNPLELAEKLNQMLQGIGRKLKGVQDGHGALDMYGELINALEESRYEHMAAIVPELADLIAAENSASQRAAHAIRQYRKAALAGNADRPEIFYLVSLSIVAGISPK